MITMHARPRQTEGQTDEHHERMHRVLKIAEKVHIFWTSVAHTSIVFSPRVLLQKAVDNLLHCEVRNELILCKMCPRHRIKMTNSLTNTH